MEDEIIHWMASPTRWTWVWVSSGSWWWWAGKPAVLQSTGLQRFGHNWATELNRTENGTSDKEPTCQCRRYKRHRFDPWVGKIPWRREWQLQYSCLENPMDRAAWQATVCRVAKSWTWLKWLSSSSSSTQLSTLSFPKLKSYGIFRESWEVWMTPPLGNYDSKDGLFFFFFLKIYFLILRKLFLNYLYFGCTESLLQHMGLAVQA